MRLNKGTGQVPVGSKKYDHISAGCLAKILAELAARRREISFSWRS
jgi:hypothetical protein